MKILLLRFNTLKIRRNAVPPFNLDFFRSILLFNGFVTFFHDMFLSDMDCSNIKDYTHIIIESYSYNIRELYDFLKKNTLSDQILISTGNFQPSAKYFSHHIPPFDEKTLKKIFSIRHEKDCFSDFVPDISHSDKYSFLYPIPYIKNIRWKYTISGAGCPGQCRFCSGNIRKGPKYPFKFRNIKVIINELTELKKSGFNYIVFDDDNFFRDRDFAVDLMKAIIEADLDIKWNTHARADSIDEEITNLLKRSGCCFLRIGAESGSNDILTQCGKGSHYEKSIYKTAILLKKYDIPFIFLIILGMPGETRYDVFLTFRMILKTNPFLIQLHNFVPYEDSYYGNLLGISHNHFHYSSFKKSYSGYSWRFRDCSHILIYIFFIILKFINLDIFRMIFYYIKNPDYFRKLFLGNRQ